MRTIRCPALNDWHLIASYRRPAQSEKPDARGEDGIELNLEGDSAQVGLGEFGNPVEDRLRGCRDQLEPQAIGASSGGAKDPEHQPSPGVYAPTYDAATVMIRVCLILVASAEKEAAV